MPDSMLSMNGRSAVLPTIVPLIVPRQDGRTFARRTVILHRTLGGGFDDYGSAHAAVLEVRGEGKRKKRAFLLAMRGWKSPLHLYRFHNVLQAIGAWKRIENGEEGFDPRYTPGFRNAWKELDLFKFLRIKGNGLRRQVLIPHLLAHTSPIFKPGVVFEDPRWQSPRRCLCAWRCSSDGIKFFEVYWESGEMNRYPRKTSADWPWPVGTRRNGGGP